MTTSAMDFSHLPEVHFTQQDASKVLDAIILIYEKLAKRVVYPGEPLHIILKALAVVISQQNIMLDQIGKLNLLRYATGPFLDHLGAMLDTPRLGEAPAETTMRFSIAQPINYTLVIPNGTRVTPDSKLFFATTAASILPIGDTYVDIPAQATEIGTTANGLVPGQINKLVDRLPVVVTVSNLTRSSGGTEAEKDDPYRARIHMAPEKFTCAGSEQSYIYFALSARPDIQSIVATSPSPGKVDIYVLLKGGIIPEQDGPELRDVMAALSADKIRPLTDHLSVLPAVAEDLDYVVTYYLTTPQAGFIEQLDEKIKAAAAEWETWQCGAIGRDINPDVLIKQCVAAGAKRVVVEAVTRDDDGKIVTRQPLGFRRLEQRQVARIAERDNRVIAGGLEDE
ncbi:MAG: baseplate J/gp47 family protein [Planctomycetaceae bacterium]|nr:baseplate J/gp47 family protein [Planctomycetaceae bacterium]